MKHSRFLLSLIFAAFVFPAPSNAAAMIKGAGSKTCAQFLADIASEPRFTENIYFDWAVGYMSGLNSQSVAYARKFRDLSASSAEQTLRIRTFCNQKPSAKYLDAVLDVYGAIEPQQYQPDAVSEPSK